MCRIAFIPKDIKNIELIKKQLYSKKISNIDVLTIEDDISSYEFVEYDNVSKLTNKIDFLKYISFFFNI